MSELRTIEKRVEKILKEDPLTRNCDRHLVSRYMFKYHNITTFTQYEFSSLSPSVESIRRCRQKMQARGDYMASEPVKAIRKANQKVHKSYALNP